MEIASNSLGKEFKTMSSSANEPKDPMEPTPESRASEGARGDVHKQDSGTTAKSLDDSWIDDLDDDEEIQELYESDELPDTSSTSPDQSSSEAQASTPHYSQDHVESVPNSSSASSARDDVKDLIAGMKDEAIRRSTGTHDFSPLESLHDAPSDTKSEIEPSETIESAKSPTPPKGASTLRTPSASQSADPEVADPLLSSEFLRSQEAQSPDSLALTGETESLMKKSEKSSDSPVHQEGPELSTVVKGPLPVESSVEISVDSTSGRSGVSIPDLPDIDFLLGKEPDSRSSVDVGSESIKSAEASLPVVSKPESPKKVSDKNKSAHQYLDSSPETPEVSKSAESVHSDGRADKISSSQPVDSDALATEAKQIKPGIVKVPESIKSLQIPREPVRDVEPASEESSDVDRFSRSSSRFGLPSGPEQTVGTTGNTTLLKRVSLISLILIGCIAIGAAVGNVIHSVKSDVGKKSGAVAKEEVPPSSWRAIYEKGLDFEREGKLNLALRQYSRALDVDPEQPQLWNGRGRVLTRQKQFVRARAELEKAIELAPDDDAIKIDLAALFYYQKEYEKSLEIYDEILGRKEKDLDALYGRALCLLRQKNEDEALAILEEVITLDPSYEKAYQQLAETLMDKKEYDRAIEILEEAVAKQPESALLNYQLGLSLYKENRKKDSIPYFNRAIELRPSRKDYINDRGFVYLGLGRYDDAIADFERSLELDPSYTLARQNLQLAKEALMKQ